MDFVLWFSIVIVALLWPSGCWMGGLAVFWALVIFSDGIGVPLSFGHTLWLALCAAAGPLSGMLSAWWLARGSEDRGLNDSFIVAGTVIGAVGLLYNPRFFLLAGAATGSADLTARALTLGSAIVLSAAVIALAVLLITTVFELPARWVVRGTEPMWDGFFRSLRVLLIIAFAAMSAQLLIDFAVDAYATPIAGARP